MKPGLRMLNLEPRNTCNKGSLQRWLSMTATKTPPVTAETYKQPRRNETF